MRGTRAKEIEKEDVDAAAARQQKLEREAANDPAAKARLESQKRFEVSQKRFEERRQKWREEQLARVGPPPPLFALFNRIQEQARQGSSSFSGGGREPGCTERSDWHEWQTAFEGETVAGELRINSDAEELLFREKTPPNRRLEFRTDRASAFSLEISKPNGDSILLRQDRGGRFFMVAMAEGQKFVGQSASFLGLLKEYKGPLLNQAVEILSELGLRPLAALNDARLRDVVIRLLSRTPEELIAGKDLLSDLESDDDSKRNHAGLLLYSRYNLFTDLIHEKALSSLTPADVKSALDRVIADRKEPRVIGDTLAVLDLANEPRYLVSLLDGADPTEYLTIVRRLKAITGQKPGNDAAAWQKWAATQLGPPSSSAEAKQRAKWKGSSLLEEGELQAVSSLLARMFTFNIESGVLRSKPQSLPYTVFSKVEEQARAGSQVCTGGSGGGWWGPSNSSFTTDTVRGRMQTTNDFEEVVLTEMRLPRRTLEYRFKGRSQFRLRLSNVDGDLITIDQASNWRFSIIAIVEGGVFANQAKSFLEFFRGHRRLMESEILPALAKFGFSPIVSTDAPSVHVAVLGLLVPPKLIEAESRRLLADLDDDDFNVREKASKMLRLRYTMYKDLIQQKLTDKAISAEAQARLNRVVAEQTESAIAERTAAALDLKNDPIYLISLLDDATPEESPIVFKRLQKLTGETLEDDIAAWKEWAKAAQK
jgi:hypothetical protein